MEYNVMMANIYEEKMREKGFQTLQIGASKFLCPLTGIIRIWPHGQEVFITNIPSEMTECELYAWFSKFGQVWQIRMPLKKSGESKTFAFVLYGNKDDAIKAVTIGHNMTFKYLRGSWKVNVKLSLDNRRLFVKNIPQTLTCDQMEEFVALNCTGFKQVILFKMNYCFVEFKSHRQAAIAKDYLKNALREKYGDDIFVNWAHPEPMVDPNRMRQVKTLFIRGLAWETNTGDMVTEISERVQLASSSFTIKKEKDYAFVEFSTKDQAERANTLLGGASIGGRRVSVCWARPQDRRTWIMPGWGTNQFQRAAAPYNQRAIDCSVLVGRPTGASGGQMGWNQQSSSMSEEIAKYLCIQNEIPFENGKLLNEAERIAARYAASYKFKWSDGVGRVSSFTPDSSLSAPLSFTADTSLPSLLSFIADTSMPDLLGISSDTSMPDLLGNSSDTSMPDLLGISSDTSMPDLLSSQSPQMGQNISENIQPADMGFLDFPKWTSSINANNL